MAEKKATVTVRMKVTPSNDPMTPENSVALPYGECFDMLKKELALDQKVFDDIMDGFMRNTIRHTVQTWTRDFASIPLLRPKNSLWLQIFVVDEDRLIQGKFHGLGAEVALAKSHTNVVQRSRILFREAVPSLLQDGVVNRWIFSRSLFLPGCNGSMDDAIAFPTYDPLGCFKEDIILADLSVQTEVRLEVPEDIPSGVQCTEAFLFLSGDFPNKDGFSCREAILELLFELGSPINNHNLHGFWVCAASAKLSKEKMNELKGIHVPVKRA